MERFVLANYPPEFYLDFCKQVEHKEIDSHQLCQSKKLAQPSGHLL